MVAPTEAIRKKELLQEIKESRLSESRLSEIGLSSKPFPIEEKTLFPIEFDEFNEDAMQFLSELLKEEKAHEKEEPKETLVHLGQGAPLPLNTLLKAHPSLEIEKVSSITTSLPPGLSQLFEKMAIVMSIMHTSDITETRILLNSSEFSSSLFFGAEILIQEYSTAPKIFNIQFTSTPSGVNLFQMHQAKLLALFKESDLGFTVNRLEAVHTEKTPLIHRKENVSEDNQEGKEQR